MVLKGDDVMSDGYKEYKVVSEWKVATFLLTVILTWCTWSEWTSLSPANIKSYRSIMFTHGTKLRRQLALWHDPIRMGLVYTLWDWSSTGIL